MPITFAELIAGALLKFEGKIDTLDLSLLISMINEPFTFSNTSNNNNEVAEFRDNKYQLKEGYTLNTTLNSNLSIADYLKNIAQPHTLNFLQEIDLTYFVLQKINHLGGISEDTLNTKLNKVELAECLRLINEGYLYTIWTKEAIYADYQSVVLSKKGEVYLFVKTYQREITNFQNELLAKGYNPDLIGVYLITKNLRRPFNEIFDISSFEYFGHIYDLNIHENPELSR